MSYRIPMPEPSTEGLCPECAICWYHHCRECAGLDVYDQAACYAVVDDIKGRSADTHDFPEFVEFPPRPEPVMKKKRKKKRPPPKWTDLKKLMRNPDPFGG
jgi:hypothetical protein